MVEHFGATNFSNANQQATVNKRRDRVSLNREAPWVSMSLHEIPWVLDQWLSTGKAISSERQCLSFVRHALRTVLNFSESEIPQAHSWSPFGLLRLGACTKWEHHQVHDIAVWVLKLTHFNDDGKEIGWKAICKRHPERPKAIFPSESHLHGRANEQWAPLSHASVSLRKFFARKSFAREKNLERNLSGLIFLLDFSR